MKKHLFKMLIISFFLVCILLGIFTEFFGNVWCLLTGRGYFIPKESNIFVFKVTEDNDGSGEYWIYGEDKNYFYRFIDTDSKYYKLKKGNETEKFNKLDYTTWDNKERVN
jgi:hypothetical protein